MGVLIISGSPRKKGNTELLLSVFKEELERNDISTEFISLSEAKINHCMNCDKCRGINRCIQDDDFNSIYEKALNNQGLVIGTPVYVGAPSSLVLALIQRLTYVSYNNQQTLSKKVGGPIAVAGEAGQLATLNCLVDFYLVNEMVIPSSTYWNIGFGVNKGDIKQDDKGKSYVTKFAQNLVWVIKSLEEEK